VGSSLMENEGYSIASTSSRRHPAFDSSSFTIFLIGGPANEFRFHAFRCSKVAQGRAEDRHNRNWRSLQFLELAHENRLSRTTERRKPDCKQHSPPDVCPGTSSSAGVLSRRR